MRLLPALVFATAVSLSISHRCFAQQPAAPPQPPALTEPPQAAKADDAAAPAATTKPQANAPAPPQPAEKGGGMFGLGRKKEVYTGPTEIVELPPTPMLDEEGKQRLDPDGKPMFNQPVKQQRDKFGHPLFTEGGKPVFQTATELGYDEHGKKLHAEKVKPPKMTPAKIARGTLSVDGMTARAGLNYEIADLKFIYLFAPGLGTVVISPEPFPGATARPNVFEGKLLTVTAGDHLLQLASDTPILGKDPKAAYVLLNRQFLLPSSSPVMGYGNSPKAPYMWPGSKPNTSLAGSAAPPVPENMLPTQLLKPCPAGQMRRPAPRVLPGQAVPEQPCVPITSVKSAKPEQPSAAVAGTH